MIMRIKSIYIWRYAVHFSLDPFNQLGLTIETGTGCNYRSIWLMITPVWQRLVIDKFGFENSVIHAQFGFLAVTFNCPFGL